MAATTPAKHVVVDAGGFIRNAPIRVGNYVFIRNRNQKASMSSQYLEETLDTFWGKYNNLVSFKTVTVLVLTIEI